MAHTKSRKLESRLQLKDYINVKYREQSGGKGRKEGGGSPIHTKLHDEK